MNQTITTRFQELSQDAVEIDSIQDLKKFNQAFFEWQMKCQQILNITCGENSNYAKTFLLCQEMLQPLDSALSA